MWQKVKNYYHLGVAIAANIYYGFPARNLTVIGVTGTDGKTTTVNLIYHILKTAGKEVSMISTVGATIHGKPTQLGFHVTNPASMQLQKFLKEAVSTKNLDKKNNFLVLEVTSHGIDQFRIWGIPFTLGLITNITHEHLDYHKSYKNYVKTKSKLLNLAQTALTNRDDDSYELIQQELRHSATQKAYTYGLTEEADYNPKTIFSKIDWNGFNRFTKYNVLAAISACSLISELDNKSVTKAIETFTHPTGRQDIVYNKLFKIIIDFAHTPNAFENILSSIDKKEHKKIIHVFGSAGKRDSTKRPLMGHVSSLYSDVIILTSEDPRKEDVKEINKDIQKKIFNFQFSIFNEKTIKKFSFDKGKKYLFEIPDRQQAINAAVSMAQKGDVILLTGKAHEKSMNYGKGEEPWNEYTAVESALKKVLGDKK